MQLPIEVSLVRQSAALAIRDRVAGGGNRDGSAVTLALVVEAVVVSRPQHSARTKLVPFSVTSEEALDRRIPHPQGKERADLIVQVERSTAMRGGAGRVVRHRPGADE
jgi:hypothetical protein